MKVGRKPALSHKYAELLRTALFFKRTQPTLRTLDLLKIMGFKIADLQRRFRGSLPSPRPHLLAWNPRLKWGVCLCGKWEVSGVDEAVAAWSARRRKEQAA